MIKTSLGIVVALLFAAHGRATDWPMSRGDAARSGYTAQTLPPGLSLKWSIAEQHAPMPAWPSSKRLTYDRAYPVVIADATLYYATSSDNRVVAVDAVSGKQRWTYVTDAAVRFAPVVWRDRIFVASDDGFLYCLAAKDGSVCWKLRGGPRVDMLLGNDRMISRWPARGGPVVADDIVYFGAGIWPSEGIYLYALDAATGKIIWQNDSSGAIEMDQPHPTAHAKSGASAQGGLVVAGDALLVPTGRAVPAVLDRADGKFRYFHLQANRSAGGSEIAAIDEHFFNSGIMFATADGKVAQSLGLKVGKKGDKVTHSYVANIQVAAHPKWIVYSSENHIMAVDRQNFLVDNVLIGRKGEKTKAKALAEPAWDVELPVPSLTSLIVAGDCVIAGMKDAIVVLDVASGQTRWQTPVRGAVYDLAVAAGRLYASTDQGVIYCFDRGKQRPIVIRKSRRLPVASNSSPFAAAAEEIVRRGNIRDGYCLDLACGDGRLALELAQRTKLQIYAVDADLENVQAARRLLDAAGLYGVRVTVHHADPATVAYPNYFADLVVSGRSVSEGAQVVPQQAMARMQRPYGGIACIGRVDDMQTSSRGPLAGAGDWSHQYADPANTLCSADTRARSPLEMLWFRDTDIVMPSRHGRGPAPLVAQGRMFVEGRDSLRAVNIYNGSTLWEVAAPGILAAYHQDHLGGVAVTGSNICLGEDRLFFHNGRTCTALDTKTGQKLTSWSAPLRPDGKPGTWGYLAYAEGTLFGSLANEEHLVKESWKSFLGQLDMSTLLSESILLFALDAETGKQKWSFAPQHSIRHNAITIGKDRVYLIDRPLEQKDTPRGVAKKSKPEPAQGRLLCLDAKTGKLLWKAEKDVFGTLLALSQTHDVLVMSYQATRFNLDSEVGGRIGAYRASDGTRLWDVEAKYRSRPIINDKALYVEPGKWDLVTGEALPFEFKRSYGCGILAGCKQLLVYRSATLGYYDLEGAQTTENYGGIRPGCWINVIPAGGLVLMADAASWCTCSYLNQATVALQPAGR